MPGSNSLYWKIHYLVEFAGSSRFEDLTELVDQIRNENPGIFQTRQFDPDRDEFKEAFSKKSVRKTIRISQELGLLNDNAKLTKVGRRALRTGDYNKTIAAQINDVFIKRDVKKKEVNLIINKCLKGQPITIPTARSIWERIDANIGLHRFSSLMTLLTHCGGAKASQKKIYLIVGD